MITEKDRSSLLHHGMTEAEVNALDALDEAVDLILRLPTRHPSGRDEAAAAIHRLQDLILARPAMRALGWPRLPSHFIHDTHPDAEKGETLL